MSWHRMNSLHDQYKASIG
uniref:Uncharacterized protein n=1 Tax=Arundo donax TaxID=35708 RepID=A0A0A9HK98_ARUDO